MGTESSTVESKTLAPVYQALVGRFSSITTVRWQLLALGLTAQGFIIGAASQIRDRPVTAVLLAAVILLVGAVVIIAGRFIELLLMVDRILLDQYEERMLPAHAHNLRLQHGCGVRNRAETVLKPLDLLKKYNKEPGATWWIFKSDSRRRVFKPDSKRRLLRGIGPAGWLFGLEFLISVAGAAIPILGIFGY